MTGCAHYKAPRINLPRESQGLVRFQDQKERERERERGLFTRAPNTYFRNCNSLRCALYKFPCRISETGDAKILPVCLALRENTARREYIEVWKRTKSNKGIDFWWIASSPARGRTSPEQSEWYSENMAWLRDGVLLRQQRCSNSRMKNGMGVVLFLRKLYNVASLKVERALNIDSNP